MPDYKEMYFKLFRAHARIVAILEQVEAETEEMYMNSKEPIECIDNQKSKQDNEQYSVPIIHIWECSMQRYILKIKEIENYKKYLLRLLMFEMTDMNEYLQDKTRTGL